MEEPGFGEAGADFLHRRVASCWGKFIGEHVVNINFVEVDAVEKVAHDGVGDEHDVVPTEGGCFVGEGRDGVVGVFDVEGEVNGHVAGEAKGGEVVLVVGLVEKNVAAGGEMRFEVVEAWEIEGFGEEGLQGVGEATVVDVPEFV